MFPGPPNTQPYAPNTAAASIAATDVRQRLQQTIDHYVSQRRSKAADVFLSARRTDDRAKKLKLLIETYGILKELADKYPEAELIGKVRTNLAAVREAIVDIDPSALENNNESQPE